MLTYVIDIDRTICDNSQRVALLEKACPVCKQANNIEYCLLCDVRCEYTEKSFMDFLDPDLMKLDKPIESAQKVLQPLLKNTQHSVIFLTGRRSSDHREITLDWLSTYFGKIRDCDLLMRSNFDLGMKPSDFKEKKFLKYRDTHSPSHYLFFEDDPYIWTMYSKYGIVFKCPEAWDTFNPLGLPRIFEPTYNK